MILLGTTWPVQRAVPTVWEAAFHIDQGLKVDELDRRNSLPARRRFTSFKRP